jgi:hypothetical protein
VSRICLQVADKIIEGMQKKLLTTSAKKMSEFHHSNLYQNGQALSVVVAAGPFTTADNLEYEPLEELLSTVASSKPDVLILMGPFVDASHPLLQEGDATLFSRDDDGTPMYGQEHSASYEMVFIEKIIRDGLSSYFNSADDFGGRLPTQVVLVPSLLDAHHECVYPQPPFGDRDRLQTSFFTEPLGTLNVPHSSPDDPGRRVHLAPNPCMFRYPFSLPFSLLPSLQCCHAAMLLSPCFLQPSALLCSALLCINMCGEGEMICVYVCVCVCVLASE